MIEIANKTKEDISRFEIENGVKSFLIFLKKEGIIKKEQGANLSIAIIKKDKIKKLNSDYRKKNEATDVLSFCYSAKKGEVDGEVVLNLDTIDGNARKYKKTLFYEFYNCLFHGILHIIGFKHGDKMFKIQEDAMNLIVE